VKQVLVIPEDGRKDKYILKPIITAAMTQLGVINPKIRVFEDPEIGGYSQATDIATLELVVARYSWIDLFLLVVDRDGSAGKDDRLRQIRAEIKDSLGREQRFFGVAAWQEVEVWGLAGMEDFGPPPGESWSDVRREPHPKEVYFDPYVDGKGWAQLPGGGRKAVGEAAAKNYKRVRQRCEEIQSLEKTIRGEDTPASA